MEFTEQSLDPSACFLCGKSLTPENRSDEHVFPKWLLRRYDLWNERMTLLNWQLMRYSALRISCCRPCNNNELAGLEEEVSTAFAAGVAGVRALPQQRLFLWLAKFFYGLVFREMTLHRDIRDPAAGSIVDDEILRVYAIHHLLLRAIRMNVECNEFPASIFIFEALTYDDPKANFDYFDAFDVPFVSIRIGSVLVVAALQDWGALSMGMDLEASPHFEMARQVSLHMIQCLELTVFLYYWMKEFDRVPKLVIGKDSDGGWHVSVLPLQGMTSKPLFRSWNSERYTSLIQQYFYLKIGLKIMSPTGPPTALADGDQPIQAPPDPDWLPHTWTLGELGDRPSDST